MKNSHKGSVSLIILIVVIIAAVIGIYYMGNQKMVRTEFIVASAITAIDDIEYSLPTSDQSPSTNEGTVDRMKISIMIPKDNIGYTNAMDKFTAEGGPYPAEGFAFVKQEVEVEYTDDLVWASANAAARTYAQSESGPYVAYLKVVDRTAYIVPTTKSGLSRDLVEVATGRKKRIERAELMTILLNSLKPLRSNELAVEPRQKATDVIPKDLRMW